MKYINKFINLDEEENVTKEYEVDEPTDIVYDPATTSLKNVFKIVNKLLDKQKFLRKQLISIDKQEVTNRDLIIKKLESVSREIEFFDSEFQRLMYQEENNYKANI